MAARAKKVTETASEPTKETQIAVSVPEGIVVDNRVLPDSNLPT